VKSRPLGQISNLMLGCERIAYRFSHTRPSVAVCFFSLSSFRASSWSDSDWAGAASCLSRIFCLALVKLFLQHDSKSSP